MFNHKFMGSFVYVSAVFIAISWSDVAQAKHHGEHGHHHNGKSHKVCAIVNPSSNRQKVCVDKHAAENSNALVAEGKSCDHKPKNYCASLDDSEFSGENSFSSSSGLETDSGGNSLSSGSGQAADDQDQEQDQVAQGTDQQFGGNVFQPEPAPTDQPVDNTADRLSQTRQQAAGVR